MPVLYNRDQLERTLTAIEGMAARIRRDLHAIHQAEQAARADGFPAANALSGSGGGKGGHSDPTLQAAATRMRADSKSVEGEITQRVHVAARLLEQADSLRAGAVPAGPEQLELPSSADVEWCRSCLRVGQCVPSEPGRKGLCLWCYRFEVDKGILPPLSVLEARHSGQHTRLSVRFVDAEVAAAKKARKAKRKGRAA